MYCCRYSICHIYYVKFIQRTYLPILYILHLLWIQYMWHILSIFYQNPHIRYIYTYIQYIYIYVKYNIYIYCIYYFYILHIIYMFIYIYTPHIHSILHIVYPFNYRYICTICTIKTTYTMISMYTHQCCSRSALDIAGTLLALSYIFCV